MHQETMKCMRPIYKETNNRNTQLTSLKWQLVLLFITTEQCTHKGTFVRYIHSKQHYVSVCLAYLDNKCKIRCLAFLWSGLIHCLNNGIHAVECINNSAENWQLT